MKRNKNQFCGIVVKARTSDFMGDLASMCFIFFAPEFADFVGDLLQSYRQTSSVSVRSQNPSIPRTERDYGL
jgi:hypothetical protein